MRIALAALLTIAPITAAGAQSESVTVNSMGVVSDSGNGQVLIDPGTGQARALPPLMQPWQFHQEPVKLHPPHKRASRSETTAPAPDTVAAAPETPKPRKHKAAPPAEMAPTENYTAVTPPKPRKQVAATPAPAAEPAPKPHRTASSAPAPQPPAPQQAPAASGFSGFADLETITSNTAPKTAPAPVKPVAAAPKLAAAAPPKPVATPPKQPTPTIEAPRPAPQATKPAPKTASIEPPKPSKPRIAAGNRRDSIAFAPNASDPSGSAVGSVRTLASSLANQLGDSNTRIQLMAYAGQKGEKTSDTRRLSLKRALVVRQLLIDDGIPAERIDVFALGGVDDDGPLDRVDVMVKG